MGEVYLAHDARLQRPVAIKTIVASADEPAIDQARLRAEARAAARINHPNVAAIYDVLETSDGPCIVMEYVEGETLAARLARGHALPVFDALRFGRQLAGALSAAHRHGVVHRDVKPGNIQVTPDGSLKLLDLGIARVVAASGDEPRTTRTATRMERAGTPAYMSPEQIRSGPIGPGTDVYSAGVVLFEMLTGRRPYDAADVGELAMRMATEPPPDVRRFAPAASANLSAIVAKALSFRPEDRFADGAGLADALAAEAEHPPLPVDPPPPVRRWRTGSIALAAALVLATAAGVWRLGTAWWSGGPGAAPVAAASLAVLPAMTLTPDAQTAQFGQALWERLVERLSAVRGLSVRGGADGARLRSEGHDVARAAADLAVTHLLDVSVQRIGGAYRVDALLLRPAREELWRRRYDGDMLAVQRQLLDDLPPALARAGLMERELDAAERARFARLPTASASAYSLYMEGRALVAGSGQSAAAEQAAALFERARAEDPSFALAAAGLSEAAILIYSRTRDARWLERASAAADEAIALDGTLAAGHYALGNVRNAAGRSEDAIRALRTAIALDPTSADAHRVLGRILADRGRADEGIRELEHAVQLAPDAWSALYNLGFVLYREGRNRDAIPHLRRVIELQPDYASAYTMLGAVHQRLGDIELATGYYEHATRISGNASAWTNLAMIYYYAGRHEAALAGFLEAVKRDPASPGMRRNAGDAYLRLGRRREAAEMYEGAIALIQPRLATNPRDAAMISLLALCEAKLGRHADAERHAAEAAALAPGNRDVHYRRAAVHALAGDRAAALAALRRAIEAGLERRLAREDEDLESLRTSPEFRRLTEEPATS